MASCGSVPFVMGAAVLLGTVEEESGGEDEGRCGGGDVEARGE